MKMRRKAQQRTGKRKLVIRIPLFLSGLRRQGFSFKEQKEEKESGFQWMQDGGKDRESGTEHVEDIENRHEEKDLRGHNMVQILSILDVLMEKYGQDLSQLSLEEMNETAARWIHERAAGFSDGNNR